MALKNPESKEATKMMKQLEPIIKVSNKKNHMVILTIITIFHTLKGRGE